MGDIRETGPRGLRYGEGTLDNNSSELNFEELMSNIDNFKKASAGQLNLMFKPTYSEPVGAKLASVGYGNSIYDENAISDWDLNNLNEVRAANQPGILQLGNGLLKMASTGVTTFLDSTVGLLWGLGQGIANSLDDNEETSFIQGLWDNDFNKAMTGIQDSMEELLPNYYSQAELNAPWYSNILSANFIGDKVLKNMGFTIGALGAMALTAGVGGAIGKGAQAAAKFIGGNLGKALGASRGTLAGINNFARGTGQFSNWLVNTAISANGEAAIEAINAQKEGLKDAYANLETRRQELINSLDPNSPDYYSQLNAIDQATNQYKDEINKQFEDAGNSTYLANMAILSLSNTLEFGHILKGGFGKSARLTDYELRVNGEKAGLQDWVRAGLRGDKIGIENTVNKGMGRIAGITAKNIMTEGTEEALQNLASNTSQIYAKAKSNEFAENSILGARINPEVTDEVTDYTKAFSKALYDNFGSPSSPGWEEFFLGGLTGGMGFMSLGRVKQKDAEGNYIIDPKTQKIVTKLRPIWEGGFMQAKREVNEEYENNQKIVDAVNNRLQDPEFVKRFQHAVASKKFSDDMSAALENNDMVEFKNSDMGRITNDVFFFREAGMIDEYKQIYKEMASGIDDKTLQQLYTATADENGNTALAQEDMEQVRQEYQDKAKRMLDKIETVQQYYDYVDQDYRDRSQLFKEELAYQYIRLDDTNRRIKQLKEKAPSEISATLSAIRSYIKNGSDLDLSVNYQDNLTDQERQDLERLERQKKQYEDKIKQYTKNPEKLDRDINGAFVRGQMKRQSLDAQGLIKAIKEAKTAGEIDSIMSFADESVREQVIQTAFEEGDEEVKEKIMTQINTSTAYANTKDRLDRVFRNNPEVSKAVENLIYSIYMGNNLSPEQTKDAMRTLQQGIESDNIDSISQYTDDFELIANNFFGEENKSNKNILLNFLESAQEQLGNAINSILKFKNGRATNARVQQEQQQQQQRQEQQKQEEEEEKDEEKKTGKVDHLKKIKENKAIKKSIEKGNHASIVKLGKDRVNSIIDLAIKDGGFEGNESDVEEMLNVLHSVFKDKNGKDRSDNAVQDTINRFSNSNINKYRKAIGQILQSQYKSGQPAPQEETLEHKDGDITSEVTEKDGLKTTKFTWWRQGKDGKVKPTTGGGVQIDLDSIDTSSFDTEDVEKPILTELREKDGKFTGTIRYSVKGEKGRQEADVRFNRDPTKPKDKKDDSESPEAKPYIDRMNAATTHEENDLAAKEAGEAGIPEKEWMGAYHRNAARIAKELEERKIFRPSNPAIQTYLDALYKKLGKQSSELSLDEQKLFAENLEKALNLVNNNKAIPENLQQYAEIILANREDNKLPPLSEENSFIVGGPNELNGAWSGLYNVSGTNPLATEHEAELANEASLVANYESKANAEKVQWTIDYALKKLKKRPVKIISPVGKTTGNTVVLYTAIKVDNEVRKAVKDKGWIIETNDGEYLVIGTLGYSGSSRDSSQADNYNAIREDIDQQIADNEVSEGYWVSSNDKHTMTITNIGDGRFAMNHYQVNEWNSDDIIELLEGPNKTISNPLGVKVDQLKFSIVYPDGERYIQKGSSDTIRRGSAQLADGKMYVMIPTPSGAYYRFPIQQITIDESESFNPDSAIVKRVNKLINDIIEKQDVKDILALKNLLVLESESQDLSFFDIYFDNNSTRVEYIPREGELRNRQNKNSDFLSNDKEEAKQQLKEIIYSRIRPFISVNLANLSSVTEIRKLSEAGALRLKRPLAVFSFVGANFTVASLSAITKGDNRRKRLNSVINEQQINYDGRTIFLRENDFYENEELITNPKEIEYLKDLAAINNGSYTGETLYKDAKATKPLQGQYFFIEKGNITVIYHKDNNGNFTRVTGSDAVEALNRRNKKKPKPFTISTETASAEQEEKMRKELGGNNSQNNAIIEIDVPTMTGGTRKEKVQKVKASELKKGDLVWYSGPESENPIGQDTILTIDNGEVWGERGLIKSKAIYKVVTPESVTPETVSDYILINNTSNGYQHIFPINDWNRKNADIRLEPDGWGTKNGLTYYKKSFTGGRRGDNVTVWFKDSPSKGVRALIEAFIQQGERLDDTATLARILNNETVYTIESEADKKAKVEARKQDAIKKATYDLEQAGIKIGDFISQGLNQDETELGKIIDIVFDSSLDPDNDNDSYSYSDINGTVYVIVQTSDPNIKTKLRADRILKSGGYYKKINKQSQKPLKGLDNSGKSSTFASRILQSLDTEGRALQDYLYSRIEDINEHKGTKFVPDELSVNELIKLYKDKLNLDLESLPSDITQELLEDIINCKL